MKKTQKRNRHQKGFTLVEIALVIAILGFIGFVTFANLTNLIAPGRIAGLASFIGTVETQSELAAIQTGCYPKKFGYLTTGQPTAGNNTCGLDAPITKSAYLKLDAIGGASANAITLPNIHPSIRVSFVEVTFATPPSIMLRVQGDTDIMNDLKEELCPFAATVALGSTQCHYNSGVLHRLIRR